MSLDGPAAAIVMILLLLTPVVFVTCVAAGIIRVANRKKSLFNSVIIAEYEPPYGLSPAEIGYLHDQNIGKPELMATLVSLEQQGLITISNGSFDGVSIARTATPAPALKPHEQYLLDSTGTAMSGSLFEARTIVAFNLQVRGSLAAAGFVGSLKSTFKLYFKRARFIYMAIVIAFWLWLVSGSHDVAGIIIVTVFLPVMLACFAPFFVVPTLVAFIVYNRIVGQPGLQSEKLKTAWPQIEGYREFVRRVELDNLQFDSEDLKTVFKNKALPYAIALGLNTDWQKCLR